MNLQITFLDLDLKTKLVPAPVLEFYVKKEFSA